MDPGAEWRAAVRRGAQGGPGAEVVRSWRRLTGGRLVKDRERRTLVACSGGADSTALVLWLWAAAAEAVVVGHVVHDMRTTAESEGDAEAVAALCGQLGVPFVCGSVAVRGAGGSVEAAARRARYAELGRMAAERGCPFVATGHQGDDQLETVVMRLVRGAGPRGLAGIAPVRRLGTFGEEMPRVVVKVVRPMLGVTRADAEAVCRAAGIEWREDATNADVSRWRARVRRDVLPVLRELRPDVSRRVAGSSALLREAAAVVERDGLTLVEQATVEDEALVWPRAWAASVGVAVLGEAIRLAQRRLLGDAAADRITMREVEKVARGIADGDRRERSWEFGRMRVRVDKEWFRIGRSES